MYDTPIFRSEFKVISHELIHALPKVILGESGDAAYMQSRVQQLADDHAAYFECTVPHEDIERAISVAEQAPFTVGILERIDDSSHYTDRSRTPVVVGFSTQSAEIAAVLRENLVPFEFDGSVADQVRVGGLAASFTALVCLKISVSKMTILFREGFRRGSVIVIIQYLWSHLLILKMARLQSLQIIRCR